MLPRARAASYLQECEMVTTYSPPRCSVEGSRLPLPSSSAAGEKRHTPPPRYRPSLGCALEAGSGSSSPINTEDRNKCELCELNFRYKVWWDIPSECRGAFRGQDIPSGFAGPSAASPSLEPSSFTQDIHKLWCVSIKITRKENRPANLLTPVWFKDSFINPNTANQPSVLRFSE